MIRDNTILAKISELANAFKYKLRGRCRVQKVMRSELESFDNTEPDNIVEIIMYSDVFDRVLEELDLSQLQ